MEHTTRTPLPMATTGCACCTPSPDSASGQHDAREAGAPTLAGASTYLVEGMTCGHCVASVMEEVSALDGVTAVDVDLVAGGASPITVTGSASADTVWAAIEKSGYLVIAS